MLQPPTPNYRLYLVGKDQRIVGAIPLTGCADDEQALTVGKAFVDGCGVEVWKRGYKLAVYPPKD